jgi:GNAT superfamily N-acetyltransferase
MTLSTDIVVRAAVPGEQPMLEALQRRASLANPGDRDAILAHPDAIALPAGQITDGDVFVADRNGDVLGFAAVLRRSDGDAELDALFVDPTLWKQGVGRKLVDHCAAVAKVRGSRILHVVGNPHAAAFYRACGFRTTGTVETRFGSGLLMRREV